MSLLFMGSLIPGVMLSPVSVCLFVGRFCQQNYTTFSEQTSTKLGGEDWSQPGIDPVNFWCRTFFEILLLISQGIMHGS